MSDLLIASSVQVALLIGISICGICSFSLPPHHLAQCVLCLMQLGRYLGQHQSFITKKKKHYRHIKLAYTHSSLSKMFAHGTQESRRGDAIRGWVVKIHFPTPPLTLILSLILHLEETYRQTLDWHETLICFKYDAVCYIFNERMVQKPASQVLPAARNKRQG